MTSSQKRYTITQIQKYKDEAESLEKKATKNKWFIYGCVGAMIVASNMKSLQVTPSIVNSIASLIQFCGLAIGLDNLKKMIENISKKVGLENMAKGLQSKIDYEPIEPDKERGRKI